MPKPKVWYDAETECYRATAPDGYRFEDSLHELVEPCIIIGYTPTRGDKAEAKHRIKIRLKEYKSLEICDDANCDWCLIKLPFPDKK